MKYPIKLFIAGIVSFLIGKFLGGAGGFLGIIGDIFSLTGIFVVLYAIVIFSKGKKK